MAISLTAAGVFASGPTQTVNANVTVPCSFGVNVAPSAAYPRAGNITINYTTEALDGCNMSNVPGNFSLYYNQGPTSSFNKNFSANITPAAAKAGIPVNSLRLSPGLYDAKLTFSTPNYTNTSTAQFYLLDPSNLTIENFTVGSTGIGSLLTLYIAVLNNGYYAANDLTAHIAITGPANYSLTIPMNAIAGRLATENITSQQSNLTSAAGRYTARAYISYSSQSHAYSTPISVSSYAVTAPSIRGPSSPPSAPVPKIPGLSISSAPLSISGAPGSSLLTSLGLNNTSGFNETVNVSVPEEFNNITKPSASSVILKPRESVSINLLFSSKNVTPGSYIVPINITASTNTKSVSSTTYVTYTISQPLPGRPAVSTQIELTNNTAQAYGIISITTPAGASISNSTFTTYLPAAIAANASQVHAFGLPNNVTEHNGYYELQWFPGQVPPNQTIYGYFTINKPQNPQLFYAIKTTIFSPAAAPSSILRILQISAPTFYSGSTKAITVELLYTGSASQAVHASLTGPSFSTIFNSSQGVNATPNQLISLEFYQRIGNYTGTLMDTLGIYTYGASMNYTIPIISIAGVQASTPTTIQQPVGGAGEAILYIHKYLLITTIIVVGIALAAAIGLSARRSRYSIDRIHELSHIKERMKRAE